MGRNSKRKSVILLEKCEMETLTLHRHDILAKQLQKVQRTSHTKLTGKREKYKTSNKHSMRCFHSKSV
jgi:hypothetical protein